ncbi:MAG: hypothetical protein PVJ04_14355 [Gemmatimonadota bacterium]
MTNEKRMAAAALLISLFVAGVVGGVAFTRVVQVRRGPEPPGRWGGENPGGGMPPVFMPDSTRPPRGFAPMALSQRLSQTLGLTEDQAGRLEAIIAEREAAASAIMETIGPKLQAQFDSMTAAIRALLTSDQAEVFDGWLEREEAFRRRPPGEGPGGRMPPGGDPTH